MAYRLIYTRPAVRDLEEIVRFIAQDRPEAAQGVGLALVELAESLLRFPLLGTQLRHRPGVRKAVHAPYVVLYRVDDTGQQIRIQRFWHAKRNPRSLHTE
ncbi:MAG: type II toxin-antitoxin system RelE/ParE family toxin [Opitutaceae bacterium]|jgi:plasmid stabilization system protein ParE|nr:type II toxin-antitoxin system RelE/ParE family toxin [Opitutaceae bacterium]